MPVATIPDITLARASSEPALAAALTRALAAGREESPLTPAYVLVGSNLVGRQLSHAFARESGGFVNVEFRTFIDLARRLAGPVKRLPAGGEEVILAALARDLPAGDYFYGVKDKPGFVPTLARAVADCREAGLASWPREFNVGGEGAKTTSFGRLYDGYRKAVTGKGYADDYDLFTQATEQAPSFPSLCGAEELFVFGFYDFNEVQWRFLEALAGRVRLRVFMPYDDARAFAFGRETRERWRGMGAREERPDAAVGNADERPAAEVKTFGPFACVSTVTVVSAPDEEREAREVAREALRLVRDEGVRFGEMAVLSRGDGAPAALTEILDYVEIPYYLDGGRPLAATRAGDGVRRLLELARGREGPRGYGRREVMDFVAVAPLRWERFEAAVWDEVTAAAGVTQGRESWARLKAYARRYAENGETPPHDAADVGAVAAFAEAFFDGLGRFPVAGSWRGYAGVLGNIMNEFFEAGDERDAILGVIEGLDLYDNLGVGDVDLATFARVLTSRLASNEPKTRAPRRGSEPRFEAAGINIIKLEHARGLSFRAVFILGVNEGAYPERRAQDPILLDDERSKFNELAAGRCRFALRTAGVAEEPLLFQLALGAAREFLYLSYHRADEGGRERLPSYYLLALAGALARRKEPFAAEDFDRAAGAYPWFRRIGVLKPPPLAEALDEEEYWAAAAADGTVGNEAVAAYLARADEGCAAAAAARASRRDRRLTPYDGVIVSEPGLRYLERLYGGDVVKATPGELEALASCPRAFFFLKVLGLRAWEEPEEPLAFPASARGSAVHAVLRDVYRWLTYTDDATPDDVRNRVAERLAAAFAGLAAAGQLPPAFIAAMEREALNRKLAAFVGADLAALGDRKPTYFEFRFGKRPREAEDPRSRDEPFLMKPREGPAVEVHGRIDRVDVAPTGARVIDYKTGKAGTEKGLAGGRQLQPALYLLAYRCAFGGAADEAGYCFPLAPGKQPYYKLTVERESGFDEDKVTRLVAGWLGAARAGLFLPATAYRDAGAACSYCSFYNFCAVTGEAWREGKTEDAVVARLTRLAEEA